MIKKYSFYFLFLVSLFVARFAYALPFEPKEGDLIFQHLNSELSNVIASATHSQVSHVGIIVKEQNQWMVLEAIGPVIYTPLETWIKRGIEQNYTIMRTKNLTEKNIQQALKEAKTFLGKPYDIQYELDDAKIYCSELVYKGFLKGAKIELGHIEKLKELNWKPHEQFIRQTTGGIIPLEREMVTPQSVLEDSDLYKIYSTF